MPDFTILDNSTIFKILINQTKSDIITFKDELAATLKEFSVGIEGRLQPDSSSVVRPDGPKTLFRPFTSPTAVGAKIIVTPAPVPITTENDGRSTYYPPLQGILTICDQAGRPTSIMGAGEITGFRTSLSALIPWFWRRNTENIVVFGAGKQALWHIRLALALRGDEINSITIVNRSANRGQALLHTLRTENDDRWKSTAKLAQFNPSSADHNPQLQALLTGADAIFCTVASTEPLFSLRAVVGNGRKKGYPFISAIGSWQPDMIELEPDILKYAISSQPSFYHQEGIGGVIIVDDCAEAMTNTGEIIKSGLSRDQLVELGQVIQWRQDASGLSQAQKERFTTWIEEGFVVLKAVGVSSTDLACGNKVLQLATERGFGTIYRAFE